MVLCNKNVDSGLFLFIGVIRHTIDLQLCKPFLVVCCFVVVMWLPQGVVIKYSEPPEARQPKTRWRLYQFKGEECLS